MDEAAERPLLNTIRWVSAALVGFGHLFLLVFHPYKFDGGPLVPALLTVLANARHAWVVLFFVLSGYLVGGGVLARGRSFRLLPYFINRFSRIYIALIPALLLTAALDGAAFAIGADGPPYRSHWPSGVLGGTAPFDHYSLSNVLASIFSLENVWTDPFGSDGPLWSLGYEWVFYFTLPLIVISLRALRRTALWQTAGVLATAALLLALGRSEWAIFWLIWCAGVLTRVLAERGWEAPAPVVLGASIVLVLAIAASGVFSDQTQIYIDPIIATAFAIVISRHDVLQRSMGREMDHRFAGFSYSFYIVHVPVILFLIFICVRLGWLPLQGLDFSTKGVALMAAIFSLATLVAYLFGRAFESRTHVARALLTNLFGVTSKAQRRSRSPAARPLVGETDRLS
jgi:peptidoglycan/LPS O-acetylase OafA/YrhL